MELKTEIQHITELYTPAVVMGKRANDRQVKDLLFDFSTVGTADFHAIIAESQVPHRDARQVISLGRRIWTWS